MSGWGGGGRLVRVEIGLYMLPPPRPGIQFPEFVSEMSSYLSSGCRHTFLDVSDVFGPDGRFEDLGTIDKRYSLSVDVVIPFRT